MKKAKNRYLFMIITGLFCVLFNAITLLVADLHAVKASFWSAFAFINVSFVVVAIVFFTSKLGKNDVITLFAPQYRFTAIYFVLTFVVNFIFLVTKSSPKVTANLIINLIIIVAYTAVMIIAHMGASHIKENEARIEAKVSALRGLEVKISTLSYGTSDMAVKKKLNELKEKVHFSDPMSNDAVAQIEQEIVEMTDIIGSLISNGAEADGIINAINDCINKVKIRNQTLMSSK